LKEQNDFFLMRGKHIFFFNKMQSLC